MASSPLIEHSAHYWALTLDATTIICALRDPARDAFGQRIAAQLAAELLQALVRTAPFQVAYRLLERNVVSQRRQAAIQ